MSRAFVKEDSAESAPIIPPRAALPTGTPNYVTPQGFALLQAELAQLQRQRTQVDTSESEDRTRQLTILNGQLSALAQRLNSAKVVDSSTQPADQVRFGATVTLQLKNEGQSSKQRFTIVGVDEASVAQGRVAFVAPIARALLGARVGQTVSLPMGSGAQAEVVAISYEQPQQLPSEASGE